VPDREPINSTALYQALLARRSVRRYSETGLNATTLAQVQAIAAAARPLIPANRLVVTRRDDMVRQDLVTLLGAYGRLISPPHALVPWLQGDAHLLTDLGYRVEQIVVRLTALGVGTCYIGTLPREEQVRATLGLPEGARIGALVLFGRPAASVGGRAFNNLIRSALGRNKEPELERIFFQDRLDNPTRPPDALCPLMLAAERAPSACNAQPWRFLWRDGRLTLFVTRDNPKYGSGPGEQYCLYDAGIAMANVALAMEAHNMMGGWQLVEPDAVIPPHPDDLHPIASLVFA
jgi:nitroreductase